MTRSLLALSLRLLCAVSAGLPACSTPEPAVSPRAEAPPSGPAPSGLAAPAPSAPAAAEAVTVFFTTATGEVPVRVEIARTEEARQRGLMHRQALDAGHGMIFLMPADRAHAFWMRNTLIPLDMIFVNADRVVVGIVAEAAPLTDTPRRVRAPSRYVVEIPGGHAARMGITEGSRMRATGIPELAR
jgi:uncharacterized membrane protein (UPF0127 family)